MAYLTSPKYLNAHYSAPELVILSSFAILDTPSRSFESASRVAAAKLGTTFKVEVGYSTVNVP